MARNQSPDSIAVAYNHNNKEKASKKVTMADYLHPSKEKGGGGGHHEANKFSEFINRVRDKRTRTTTVQGGGDGGGKTRPAAVMRRDSFNDRVSNFIHTAMHKIRRTSSNVGADDHGNPN
nr:uncharacterized protein LOC104114001 [Ipomoea batatas]